MQTYHTTDFFSVFFAINPMIETLFLCALRKSEWIICSFDFEAKKKETK